MTGRTDPRITRTVHSLEEAIVGLAAEQPVSRIAVAALAERAGVTRATVYNRYASPLDLLIQVLYADLDRGHRREEQLRAEGALSDAEMLRLTVAEVADHVERFQAVYRHALPDPPTVECTKRWSSTSPTTPWRSWPDRSIQMLPAPSTESSPPSWPTVSPEPSLPGSVTTP